MKYLVRLTLAILLVLIGYPLVWYVRVVLFLWSFNDSEFKRLFHKPHINGENDFTILLDYVMCKRDSPFASNTKQD